MSTDNRVYSNICPYCNKVVTFEKEDNRADTDRGVFGGMGYFCSACDSDVTDDFDFEEQDNTSVK